MMQIFVINLAQRSDRMAQIQAQLTALGLAFTRIEAVNGLGEEDIGYPSNHPRLTKGEYACYLSHVEVWRQFVASGAERCLVLEDDAVLAKSLPYILSHQPYFSHNGALTRLECRIWQTRIARTAKYRHKGRTIARLTANDGGSCGLVLSRKYAQYLLKNHATPLVPLDAIVLFPEETKFRPHIIYQMDPAPITQQMFTELNLDVGKADSDLEATRIYYPKTKPLPQTMMQKFVARVFNRWEKSITRRFQIRKIIRFDKS